MKKFINFLMTLLIVFFIFAVVKYYTSTKHSAIKNHKRSNIDNILKEKKFDLPVLINDTDNVIEFNDSLKNDVEQKKKRSFWDLLS